jgi:hypothetical protein
MVSGYNTTTLYLCAITMFIRLNCFMCNVCMQELGNEEWCVLLTVIVGPSHAGADCNILFSPLVDELIKLCDTGLGEVYDPYLDETYPMYAYLAMVSADTVARSPMMNTAGVRSYLADWRYLYRGENLSLQRLHNGGLWRYRSRGSSDALHRLRG